MLYAQVNCGHDIAAVFCPVIALKLIKQQICSVCVCSAHILAVRAAERGIILRLNAVKSDIICTDKAYNMTGKGRVGIIPFCIAFKSDAL